ncbi:hypothetical protein BAAA27672_05945 [Bifidobacterium animalis subsp. animalis ATCC 27672]|nr:hypothetical protein BAAA27672_05945 [Bifidobacterium animalis subsp. animalis ATCC 27672]
MKSATLLPLINFRKTKIREFLPQKRQRRIPQLADLIVEIRLTGVIVLIAIQRNATKIYILFGVMPSAATTLLPLSPLRHIMSCTKRRSRQRQEKITARPIIQ